MTEILVSMDEKLLGRIDDAARAAGLGRSAYSARLAQHDLGEGKGPGVDARSRRAVVRLQRVFDSGPVPEDATAAIRADRDAR